MLVRYSPLKLIILYKNLFIKYLEKFSKKLAYLTPWYTHIRVYIIEKEMLVFPKILRNEEYAEQNLKATTFSMKKTEI